jgi:hypothetical protein
MPVNMLVSQETAVNVVAPLGFLSDCSQRSQEISYGAGKPALAPELLLEGTDAGWLEVLQKNGLGPAAEILENYGIDSETDLLVLDQDDFIKLASRGLKPLHAKKLERWCEAVRERAENMLPSSLNTPAASAGLSSEELNVVTSAAHSVGAVESVESDLEGPLEGVCLCVCACVFK